MNRRTDQSDGAPDDFCESLKRLRPAPNSIDASEVFFQAGFRAGQADAPSRDHAWRRLSLAAIFAAMIAAPGGFMLGRNATVGSDPRPTIAQPASQTVPESPGQSGFSTSELAHHPATPDGSVDPNGRAGSARDESPEMPAGQRGFLAGHDRANVAGGFDRLLEKAGVWASSGGGAGDAAAEATSLAAFHAFRSDTSSRVRWPDFFVRNDARLHGEPWVADGLGAQASKTLAAHDLQAIADSFGPVR